jgi:hypothetical protein
MVFGRVYIFKGIISAATFVVHSCLNVAHVSDVVLFGRCSSNGINQTLPCYACVISEAVNDTI